MDDLLEFDPLSNPSTMSIPQAPEDHLIDFGTISTSGVDVQKGVDISGGLSNVATEKAQEAWVVFENEESEQKSLFVKKNSEPILAEPTGLVRSSPNISRKNQNIPARPVRPPPPPPVKKRATSDNTLMDSAARTTNSASKTYAPNRSSQPLPSSSFYIDSGAESNEPQANSTSKSARSGSSFFVDSSIPENNTNPTRPARSGSSFYVNSGAPESNTVLTRSVKGGSSFFVGEAKAPVTRQPSGNRLYHPRNMSAIEGDITAEKLSSRREHIMQSLMAKRQREYTVEKPYKMFVGTWNVNGQTPPDHVVEWLSTKELREDPPDLYFIGFQELDLSKEAMVFTESLKQEEWIEVVDRSLPQRKVKYELLKCQRLVGMMLLVYVKSLHYLAVTNLSFHQVGTGILGRMGNKGGVAVRMDLHNSSICAVNSHLAAHMDQCRRRNEDFHSICSKLRFTLDSQPPLTLFQHDIVFWLGDLNYRIQSLESDIVKQAVDEKGYKLLREYDQLNIEKKYGNVFTGFIEGEVNFRPTYKYNPGTDEWDTSEKFRTPAWCDRVLWWESKLHIPKGKAFHEPDFVIRVGHVSATFITFCIRRIFVLAEKPVPSVKLLKYDQQMALNISDHKPVSALFSVQIKVIDDAKYKKVFEEENRRLDKLENEYLPTMTLSGQHVNFGEVKFQQANLQTLEVVNTGMIPCNFEFISQPGKPDFCKKWLTITNSKGILFPGEKSIIEFEIYVNRVTAPLLNSAEERLDDILILHLDGGKDFFITVNGQYLPSCFGTSVEALCRLKEPIRFSTSEEIQRLSSIKPLPDPEIEQQKSLAVPKELWTLIDHLYRYGKKEEALFQQPGLHSELEEIRDRLDTEVNTGDGRQKLPGSNHSVAEALLIFLEALPEPVIPFHLYEQCVEVSDTFYVCKLVLRGMSQHHRNVFKYIVAFLRELLRYSAENGLTRDITATIFSGLILRPPTKKSTVDARIDRENAKKFISHFLEHPYDDN